MLSPGTKIAQPASAPILKLIEPACHTGGGAAPATVIGALSIALVGQPNVGKSTVFNMLTGLNQHVGNWPGKTIEQKIGVFRHNDTPVTLIDLPGTYSLSANSEEERIARDYLIQEQPDSVIAVVNAASLERSLYLVAELLALDCRLVIGLNMLDVAEQHGLRVEPHVLEAALGVPVIPLVAAKNQGVRELADAALRIATDPTGWHPHRPTIRAEHRPVLEQIHHILCAERNGAGPAHALTAYPEDWLALKLLEGDAEITARAQAGLSEQAWERVHALLLQHEDAYLDIAGGRYEWIGRMVRAAVIQPRAGAITRTERIDRVATHPLLGLLLLLTMFGGTFWLTNAVATPVSTWLSGVVLGGLDRLAAAMLSSAPAWVFDLVSNGLIHGAGTVFTFLPILVIFFAVLGILEDVGYLARGAYIMDRFMHLMGLHGKSFLPLFLGFGCNVPAVLGTRILEDRRARLLTTLLAPLVPCTARLAVLAFLAPALLGPRAAIASWGLVAGNLLVLAVAGLIVNRLAFRGEQTAFIMELPLYHVPNPRTVGLYVWNNTVSFVKKAGTLIVLASIAVWALSTLPGGGIESSYLARFGRWIAPAGSLLGLNDWRLVVALLTSFFAKENTIATLGVLFGAPDATGGLASQVAATLAPAAGLAFLVTQMLFIPCLATVATIRQETRSWRWTFASLAGMLALSVGAGIAVYQMGRIGW